MVVWEDLPVVKTSHPSEPAVDPGQNQDLQVAMEGQTMESEELRSALEQVRMGTLR